MILPPLQGWEGRLGGPEPQGLRPGLPSFARWRGLKQDPESVQRNRVILAWFHERLRRSGRIPDPHCEGKGLTLNIDVSGALHGGSQ